MDLSDWARAGAQKLASTTRATNITSPEAQTLGLDITASPVLRLEVIRWLEQIEQSVDVRALSAARIQRPVGLYTVPAPVGSLEGQTCQSDEGLVDRKYRERDLRQERGRRLVLEGALHRPTHVRAPCGQ